MRPLQVVDSSAPPAGSGSSGHRYVGRGVYRQCGTGRARGPEDDGQQEQDAPVDHLSIAGCGRYPLCVEARWDLRDHHRHASRGAASGALSGRVPPRLGRYRFSHTDGAHAHTATAGSPPHGAGCRTWWCHPARGSAHHGVATPARQCAAGALAAARCRSRHAASAVARAPRRCTPRDAAADYPRPSAASPEWWSFGGASTHDWPPGHPAHAPGRRACPAATGRRSSATHPAHAAAGRACHGSAAGGSGCTGSTSAGQHPSAAAHARRGEQAHAFAAAHSGSSPCRAAPRAKHSSSWGLAA